MNLNPLIAVAAIVLAGCATQPVERAAQIDPNCTLAVSRSMAYAGQTFTKVECAAWSFGPTRLQQIIWNKRHPGAAKKVAP